jgi:hypothetical protein
MGVPTVGVVTTMFRELVTTYAYKKGMPNQRFVFVPHPIAGVAAATCKKYLEGNDPVTGKPMLQELVAGLTVALTEKDKSTALIERPIPRLVPADTEKNLQEYFVQNGWTDGLPIVLPTEARVAAMLKGTSRKPGELVGKMQPSAPHEAWSYTVEKVAVNAVMAGAKPEHLPVILALGASGVPSIFTSTTSFARMVVVNGPIRQQLKMNAGIGALGPFNQSNSVIGRAWTLMSLNLDGGGKIGETYMGSQGNNFNYNNLCIPENEEGLPPGWNPVHVQHGFKKEESVVSLFTGWGMTHPDQSMGKDFAPQIPRWLQFISPWSPAILLLDPLITKQLKSEGYDSKEQLTEWIQKNTNLTVGDYWDNYYSVQNFILPNAKIGRGVQAEWLKLPKDAVVPRFPTANRINIIAVGGETNLFWQAGDFGHIASTSVDKWR